MWSTLYFGFLFGVGNPVLIRLVGLIGLANMETSNGTGYQQYIAHINQISERLPAIPKAVAFIITYAKGLNRLMGKDYNAAKQSFTQSKHFLDDEGERLLVDNNIGVCEALLGHDAIKLVWDPTLKECTAQPSLLQQNLYAKMAYYKALHNIGTVMLINGMPERATEYLHTAYEHRYNDGQSTILNLMIGFCRRHDYSAAQQWAYKLQSASNYTFALVGMAYRDERSLEPYSRALSMPERLTVSEANLPMNLQRLADICNAVSRGVFEFSPSEFAIPE